jgi:hypothetical protein
MAKSHINVLMGADINNTEASVLLQQYFISGMAQPIGALEVWREENLICGLLVKFEAFFEF